MSLTAQTVSSVSESGVMVDRISYPPNGTSHALQKLITDLLHRLVTANAMFTLGELGYLHINTLTYDKEAGQLRLKVYFDARFVCREEKSEFNTSKKYVPVHELRLFQNYLFVCDVVNVASYEKIMAPKTKVVENEFGHPSLEIKDSSKVVETAALVLNCSLPLTMAAALGISLSDPEFLVSCETVGKGGKSAVKSIISTSHTSEVPVAVTVTRTHGAVEPYDPAEAVPYLISLQERTAAAAQNREKLKRDVKKKADKNKAKAQKQRNKGFNKYS